MYFSNSSLAQNTAPLEKVHRVNMPRCYLLYAFASCLSLYCDSLYVQIWKYQTSWMSRRPDCPSAAPQASCYHSPHTSHLYVFIFETMVVFRLHLMKLLNEYSQSSFTNRCTFIRTLIKIYIKIRWLLHVSFYDHPCNWAWLKLYWY